MESPLSPKVKQKWGSFYSRFKKWFTLGSLFQTERKYIHLVLSHTPLKYAHIQNRKHKICTTIQYMFRFPTPLSSQFYDCKINLHDFRNGGRERGGETTYLLPTTHPPCTVGGIWRTGKISTTIQGNPFSPMFSLRCKMQACQYAVAPGTAVSSLYNLPTAKALASATRQPNTPLHFTTSQRCNMATLHLA